MRQFCTFLALLLNHNISISDIKLKNSVSVDIHLAVKLVQR